MITSHDTDEHYILNLDFYLTQGFPTDEAVRLAHQCAEGRDAARARKVDTAWWCLYLGTFLIISVFAVAVFTVTA